MDAADIRELAQLYLQYLNVGEQVIDEVRYMGRQWWTKPFNHPGQRDDFGGLNQMFIYYKFNDTEAFYTFVWMTPPQFEPLIEFIGDRLDKHSMRTPWTPELWVAITFQ